MGHKFRVLFGFVFVLLFYGALLFGPAGTLRWGRAWIFIGTILLCYGLMIVTVFRDHPDLLKERYRSPFKPDQPQEDKLLLWALIWSYTLQLAFIPMDVFHWHLLPPPSLAASLLGLAMNVFCYVMFYLTFRENSFASPVIRLQEERHQKVIDTGVYAHVRHPLYVGGLSQFFGAPLWLGSTAGFWLAFVPMLILLRRIRLEERFLADNLPGYTEYAERVRYRLLPGLY